jgi:hypothetical protein
MVPAGLSSRRHAAVAGDHPPVASASLQRVVPFHAQPLVMVERVEDRGEEATGRAPFRP